MTSPIELPPVQAAHCKKIEASSGPEQQNCIRAAQILALMSAETRDAIWADAMESFLQHWIESLEPDGFTFRNVECRKSWCIVEAGSTIGAGDRQGHDIVLDLREAQKKKIFELQALFAPDLDNPSAWDALVIFKRYCGSGSELFDGNNHLAPNFYTLGQTC
ncbi:MAG: hypothetical protein JO203_02700 [Gammaproteobacteria bacterium]|nr:hypothetical protein [Gammaproteobacteria bacterium]